MKTRIISAIVILGLWAGIAPSPAQQRPTGQEFPGDFPAQQQPVLDEESTAQLIQAVLQAQEMLDSLKPEDTAERQALEEKIRALRGAGARGNPGNSTNTVSLRELALRSTTNSVAGTNGQIRLNFRDASLSMVLNYLSEAAGFTVQPNNRVDLRGRITVISNHPVGREEAYRNAVIARVLQTFGPRARVVAVTHEPRPVYEFPAPDFVSE